MKKILSLVSVLILGITVLAGCGNNSATNQNTTDTNKPINVVSREDGSGTRGAFVELFGVEEKSADGKKKDMTTKEAIIANKTDIMMTNIATDRAAIGYVSLGSLNNTIKALEIDGIKPTAATIKNGTYKISRPFNIVTKGQAAGLAKDFIDFILSADGQAVVVKGGYIAINDQAKAYAGSKPSGKIVVAGSSSVTPIMEKLKEAYVKINPNATIEIQMSDSTAGTTGAINGTCDIGMASRSLKDSEKQKLTGIEIALDGIAVIVNNNNSLTGLTKLDIKNIFTGKVVKWNEVKK